jgi:hypothetical protein
MTSLHAEIQAIADALPGLKSEDVPRMQLRLMKLGVAVKRLERTLDCIVEDAAEDALLVVEVPPTPSVVVAFPKRPTPVLVIGDARG